MSRSNDWTDEETERLRRLYSSERSFDEIISLFPNRTTNAIRMKASRLGLKRPFIGSSSNRSTSLLLCVEGNGRSNGYLVRCGACGGWIQVKGKKESSNVPIKCGECGSTSYLVA